LKGTERYLLSFLITFLSHCSVLNVCCRIASFLVDHDCSNLRSGSVATTLRLCCSLERYASLATFVFAPIICQSITILLELIIGSGELRVENTSHSCTSPSMKEWTIPFIKQRYKRASSYQVTMSDTESDSSSIRRDLEIAVLTSNNNQTNTSTQNDTMIKTTNATTTNTETTTNALNINTTNNFTIMEMPQSSPTSPKRLKRASQIRSLLPSKRHSQPSEMNKSERSKIEKPCDQDMKQKSRR